MTGDWSDASSPLWVVWAEPEGIAIYEGEKETARRRRLLTPDEANQLAALLRSAARDVQKGIER